jgi:hypothetical protein
MRSGGWSPVPLSSSWRSDNRAFNKVAFEYKSEVTNEADMDSGHHEAAQRFRESNGTAKLKETLGKAVEALYLAEVPHLVTGGYAAQEYGCLRYTNNINLIVPDIARALAALLSCGFRPHGSSQTIAVDPETTFEVRLHAGGSVPSEE